MSEEISGAGGLEGAAAGGARRASGVGWPGGAEEAKKLKRTAERAERAGEAIRVGAGTEVKGADGAGGERGSGAEGSGVGGAGREAGAAEAREGDGPN